MAGRDLGDGGHRCRSPIAGVEYADYPASRGARVIVAADFHRDGWPDVASAAIDTAAVSVLLSAHGDGLAQAITVPVGRGPFDMTTGDLNRDGIPDLAVANADSDSLSVLIGRGDGRFAARICRSGRIAAHGASRRAISTAMAGSIL